MTYENTLKNIYALGRFGVKPGLERIRALLRALGSPQEKMGVVHIAGTNGKGSTAAFLASILREAGYRIGLYTSPHLISFTERIRVNGEEVSEAEVIRLAERVMAVAPSGTTFFEIVTAMAFLHFASREVSLAVVETGMGGSFDATNAADGAVSVITPVGFDHCDYLGSTLAAIAGEKAGIIKKGRPVVVGPQHPEAQAVIEAQCRRLGAPMYRFGEAFTAFWKDDCLSYRGMETELNALRPGIGGTYQSVNAASALAVAEVLAKHGYPISPSACRNGVERAVWPGRMEICGGTPRILLDGAHNPAGMEALIQSLPRISRQRLIVVIGIMGDKDIAAIVRPLLPLADEVLAVAPALPRAMPSADLACFCRAEGAACTDAGTVSEGISEARSRAGDDDLILVTGSLFTVGEARAFLCNRQFEPCRG